jgi:hypothetical protein
VDAISICNQQCQEESNCLIGSNPQARWMMECGVEGTDSSHVYSCLMMMMMMMMTARVSGTHLESVNSLPSALVLRLALLHPATQFVRGRMSSPLSSRPRVKWRYLQLVKCIIACRVVLCGPVILVLNFEVRFWLLLLLLLLLLSSLVTGFLLPGTSPLEPVVNPTTQASSLSL